jgi:hypothetical protein
MRDYFYAQGDGKGLPLEELQNYGYNDIMRLRIYYDWSTDDLMEVSPIRPCETWPLAPSKRSHPLLTTTGPTPGMCERFSEYPFRNHGQAESSSDDKDTPQSSDDQAR